MKQIKLAIKQNISHKKQSRANLGFATAFNQNVGLVRMTDAQYNSIIWLTQGKYAIVDNDVWDKLYKLRWFLHNHGYAMTNIGTGKNRGSKLMHRLILDEPKGVMIDHINMNPRDNRITNLRPASYSGNGHNSKYTRGTSQYRGVFWFRNRWVARISVCGKNKVLGLFHDEILAAKVRDVYAKLFLGNLCQVNFVLAPEEESEIIEFIANTRRRGKL